MKVCLVLLAKLTISIFLSMSDFRGRLYITKTTCELININNNPIIDRDKSSVYSQISQDLKILISSLHAKLHQSTKWNTWSSWPSILAKLLLLLSIRKGKSHGCRQSYRRMAPFSRKQRWVTRSRLPLPLSSILVPSSQNIGIPFHGCSLLNVPPWTRQPLDF